MIHKVMIGTPDLRRVFLKPAPIDDIGFIFKDRLDDESYFIGVVLEVCILNDQNIARGLFDTPNDRRALSSSRFLLDQSE